jgi:hypothetical protein
MKPATKPSGKAVRARVAAKVATVHDVLRATRGVLAERDEEVVSLRKDLANVSDALAEAALLLDRCTPGRFRDRELAPLIRGFAMLAGAEACARAKALDLPTLDTPSSVLPATTCGESAPDWQYHPCKFLAGHAGDHLWPARRRGEPDMTGPSPTTKGA